MKALRIRFKPVHFISALFLSVVMAGNPIASSYGLSPVKDIVRSFRVRSARSIRNLIKL